MRHIWELAGKEVYTSQSGQVAEVWAVSSLINVLGTWLRHVYFVLWKMSRNQKPIEEMDPESV